MSKQKNDYSVLFFIIEKALDAFFIIGPLIYYYLVSKKNNNSSNPPNDNVAEEMKESYATSHNW